MCGFWMQTHLFKCYHCCFRFQYSVCMSTHVKTITTEVEISNAPLQNSHNMVKLSYLVVKITKPKDLPMQFGRKFDVTQCQRCKKTTYQHASFACSSLLKKQIGGTSWSLRFKNVSTTDPSSNDEWMSCLWHKEQLEQSHQQNPCLKPREGQL